MCGQRVHVRVPQCAHCGYSWQSIEEGPAAELPAYRPAGSAPHLDNAPDDRLDPDVERTTLRPISRPIVPAAVAAPVPPPTASFGSPATLGGEPAAPAAAPLTSPAPPLPSRPAAPRLLAMVPNELLIVIGALVTMGVYTLFEGLRPLPDIAKALGSPYFGQLAWVLLLLLLIIAAFGAACLAVAYLLFKADRVGRGLAVALALALVIGALSGSGADTTSGGSGSGSWRAVILLGSAIACALLWLPQSVRDHFAQSRTRDGDRPAPVVIAQVLLAVNGGLVGLIALLYLLLGKFDGKYYVVGLFMLLLAVGFVVSYKLVGDAEHSAPIVAAAVSLITIVLQLIGGAHSLGFFIGIGLDITIVATLWLNREAVTFFGRSPSWLSQTGS